MTPEKNHIALSNIDFISASISEDHTFDSMPKSDHISKSFYIKLRLSDSGFIIAKNMWNKQDQGMLIFTLNGKIRSWGDNGIKMNGRDFLIASDCSPLEFKHILESFNKK